MKKKRKLITKWDIIGFSIYSIIFAYQRKTTYNASITSILLSLIGIWIFFCVMRYLFNKVTEPE
ncbi:MAG: hypothetical protein Q3988_06820 [Gemella sp.]|nr:hypothetical protein [Gemella sp.]